MLAHLLLLAPLVDLTADLGARAAANHLPALQASVMNHAGLVAHGAAGVTELGGTVAVTQQDAFHIGSCAKPFTATVVAMLTEEKKLAWNTRILDVFPEWRGEIRPEYRKVTMADLLSHEAGVPAFEEEAELAKVPALPGSVVERRRGFAKFALQQTPVMPPQTAYHYSNAGFVIAAAMVEQVTGKRWDELVRARIFQPLAMRSAGFGWPVRVWGHSATPDGTLTPVAPTGSYQLPDYFGPAGDLHMSTDDLATFLRSHLRAMEGETTLIGPSTAATMHTRRLKGGLGFGVSPAAGYHDVATYSGSADTFFTVFAVSAEGDVAVAVSANAAGAAAQKTVTETAIALLERYGRQHSAPR